jgi:FliI/YscN family ATPase
MQLNAYPLLFDRADGWMRSGRVAAVFDGTLVVRIPGLSEGLLVEIERANGATLIAECYSVDASGARCRPLSGVEDVTVGARATSVSARLGSFVGPQLLGKCVDAWGRASDSGHPLVADAAKTRLALGARAAVDRPLRTGVSALDTFSTLAYGQRLALLAGSGIGKSSLLRRIAADADVDVRVIALIGERGREAAEAEAHLRDSPQRRTTTLVSAAANASAVERFSAAQTAAAQAEFFAAQGARVLLLLDSLTRVANAWRELALGAGETAAHRGYPASLVGKLAQLVERAGRYERGSITAVYAVLVDGDDTSEPVSDAVRALVDGHVVLSRRLADAGRHPAVDVLRSLSRTMHAVATPQHQLAAAAVRRAIDTLERAEDLFALGAYQRGADAWLDACVAERPSIERLMWDSESRVDEPVAELAAIAQRLARLAAGARDTQVQSNVLA